MAKLSNKEILARALKILEERAKYYSVNLSQPSAVKDYCKLRLCTLEHEVFMVIFLDAQNRLIEVEEMFRGTLTMTSVFPREVVKAAMAHNASAVILSHNHPSGVVEASNADLQLTNRLKQVLELVDVRVLDHIIVGQANCMSFAERGLL